MSNNTPTSTTKKAFIDARLSQSRLTSEQAICAALTNQAPIQVQIKTDTASSFSIGLDLPETPKVIVINIDFKASLKISDTEKNLIDYEAKHEVQFALEGWIGFVDWTNVPSEAIAPYLAIVHNIARSKAELTISEMGFKGIVLPQPENFNGELLPFNHDMALS